MSTPTSRDLIWKQALEQARVHGKFKASAIEGKCADRTIRKTLAAMEELGLLARKNQRSGIWYAGPQVLQTMNVTETALEVGLREEEEVA